MNLLLFALVINLTVLQLISFHLMIKSSTLYDFHCDFVLSVVDMVLSDVFSSRKGICLDRSKPFQCSTFSFQVWQPLRHDRTFSIKQNKTSPNQKQTSLFFGQILNFTVLWDHKINIIPRTAFVTFMRKFHCVTSGAVPG